ncbi:hypothetical protein H5410_056439 [Solanum commersonii]|uniref:Uncharacterized protein n=1 Tax=Solanum commersonii TaxID=4109 RepID=A0A9J5WK88_SOLCO|nr:hypothetical protein H5410_056439 [Solanum commersonii]
MDYSIRKWEKWSVYLLWESFDPENGPVCPSGSTYSMAKITKISMNYAYRNWKNERFNHSGDPLTLTMGWFTYRDKPTPYLRS